MTLVSVKGESAIHVSCTQEVMRIRPTAVRGYKVPQSLYLASFPGLPRVLIVASDVKKG